MGRSRSSTAAWRRSPSGSTAGWPPPSTGSTAPIAHRALVRYDAYGELSGHQSISLALLDSDRNGVVLSSIAHRDTARLYCRQVLDGRGEHELSPEEDEAIRLALTGEAQRTVTLD